MTVSVFSRSGCKLFVRPAAFNFSLPGLQGGGFRKECRRCLSVCNNLPLLPKCEWGEGGAPDNSVGNGQAGCGVTGGAVSGGRETSTSCWPSDLGHQSSSGSESLHDGRVTRRTAELICRHPLLFPVKHLPTWEAARGGGQIGSIFEDG